MSKFAHPTYHTVTLPNPAGTHRMAYYEWGDSTHPRTLVCLHGLTRNGRDFDFLAAALQNDYRILAPDLIGRGKSEWLADPSLYTIEQYVKDLLTWMHMLGLKKVDWMGASLGGILGMLITAQPGSPIERLILNDVGPVIKKESVTRLSSEVEANPVFGTLAELKDFFKKIYGHTGEMQPYHWDHLLAHDHITLPEGGYARAYDPNLFKSFAPMQGQDISFWPIFKAIHIPLLVLHGEESAVLTPDICLEMKKYQPHMTMVDLPHVGHAPSLMDENHIEIVAGWLNTQHQGHKSTVSS